MEKTTAKTVNHRVTLDREDVKVAILKMLAAEYGAIPDDAYMRWKRGDEGIESVYVVWSVRDDRPPVPPPLTKPPGPPPVPPPLTKPPEPAPDPEPEPEKELCSAPLTNLQKYALKRLDAHTRIPEKYEGTDDPIVGEWLIYGPPPVRGPVIRGLRMRGMVEIRTRPANFSPAAYPEMEKEYPGLLAKTRHVYWYRLTALGREAVKKISESMEWLEAQLPPAK